MNSKEPSPVQPASPSASYRVSLSPYVNEPLPNWQELLSAHDVARLTRRPRWVVLSLALLGQFPRKYHFHGRGIGWLRSDVLTWLGKDLCPTQCHANHAAVARTRCARHGSLPLESTHDSRTAHRRLGARMGLRLRSRRVSARRSRAPESRGS